MILTLIQRTPHIVNHQSGMKGKEGERWLGRPKVIRKRKEAGKERETGEGGGERIHKMGEVSSLTHRLKCAIRHKSEAKAPIKNSIQKTPGRKTRVVAATGTSNQTGQTVVIILHCVEICDNVCNAVVQFVQLTRRQTSWPWLFVLATFQKRRP